MMKFIWKLILGSILVFVVSNLQATHLRAGYIHIETVQNRTMRVTITFYTDAESPVLFGGGTLNFGDGETLLIDEQDSEVDIETNIGIATISILHTYADYGTYIVSYTEPNRNSDIINIPNSVNTPFHIETVFALDPSLGNIPINTSHPLIELINIFQMDQENAMALTMEKSADLIYYYQLTVPKRSYGHKIDGYTFPLHISVDHITGLLRWDLTSEDPLLSNNYNTKELEFAFAIVAKQYKKLFNDKYYPVSSTTIDFQIIVTPSNNIIEISESVGEEVVEANSNVNFQKSFTATDTIEIEIAHDLPEGTFSYDIVFTDDSKQNAIVNYEIINENIQNNGPYSIVTRVKSQNYFKDDVHLIFFNEKVDLEFEWITSTENQNHPVEVSFYPNPSNSNINFNFSNYHSLDLLVVNLRGEEIFQKKIISGEIISVNNAGVYLFVLTNENGIISSGKFIIKR